MTSNTTKGIYLALVTAFISGVAIFVNKFAVGIITPPLVFTATKNIGVGLLIIGIILAAKKWRHLKNLTKRESIYLLLIGIIGGSIPFYLFFTGLSEVSAINSALIHKTLVFWVAILAIIFLKEKLSNWQVIAVMLLFGSNFIIGGFKGFAFSNGELLILIATIFWAIENILAKKILPSVDPDIVTSARMGFGSLILMVAAIATAPAALSKVLTLTPLQWFWMAATAGTLLSYIMCWYRALKLAPAITVTSILVSSTLITNILSAIFVTHTWTIEMGIQAGLILIGLGIFYFTAQKELKTTSQFATS